MEYLRMALDVASAVLDITIIILNIAIIIYLLPLCKKVRARKL